MQQDRTRRWRLVAAVIACTMILAALIVFQSAAAIDQQDEPIPLSPPFALHEDARLSPATADLLPPSAVTLLNETFGSGFAPTVGVTGTTTAWRIFTDTTSVNYYWGRVLPSVSTTFSNTVWGHSGGDGESLDPDNAGDTYPANTGAWLIYGPVNLRDYYAAELTYQYRLDANSALDSSGYGDFLAVGVSTDGTNFTAVRYTGNQFGSGFQGGTLDLEGVAGQSSVYISFYFRSNSNANVGRGAFVDNAVLRAAPFVKSYMPYMAKNFSLATATPTLAPFLYNYTFDSGQFENDPDFVTWGQSYTNKSGDTTIYEQGMIGGNPGQGMYLYNTQLNYVTMAGPNVSVSGNYEISADFHVNKGKDNARYGIVFGASTNVFSRGSGNRPIFNSDGDYYVFALQFPNGPGNNPEDFQLERCSGNSLVCAKPIDRTTIPSSANADGVWDRLTVRRSGSSITVLINGVEVGSVSDGTYTGTREFGMLIRSANVNGTSNPLEIYFDNYRVTQLP